MGCNKETLQCTHERFTPLPECCKDNLQNILDNIHNIFEKHGIIYWLDYGSLLGAVRESDIIKTDDDMDIGILRQDFEKVLSLSDEFLLRDLYVMPFFYPDFIRIDFSRSNALHVDIFIWDFKYQKDFKYLWEDKDKEIKTVVLTRREFHYEDQFKGKDIPADILFPLEKIKFRNKYYNCPNDPEFFVKFRYGEDWKIPKNI